jgi:hypothetical protein
VKEVQLAQLQHAVAADRGLEGEVEVVERLAGGEPRLFAAAASRLSISVFGSVGATCS